QNFAAAVRIDGFRGHALTTKVHVSGISNGHDVFGKDEARSYFVVAVARRNEKPVIPDLVLRHAMGDRGFREYKADAGTVRHGLSKPVAVVHLKLQVRASGNLQRVTGRTNFREMPRKIDGWNDVDIAGSRCW